MSLTVIRERYLRLRGAAQTRVKRIASRVSGFDEHLAKVHPPAGLLTVGPLTFDIETLVFKGGQLHVRARASVTQAGRMEGAAVICGLDGVPALSGAHDVPFIGVKTRGSVWEFDYAIDLGTLRSGGAGITLTEHEPRLP